MPEAIRHYTDDEKAAWEAEFEAAGETHLREFLSGPVIWPEPKKQVARQWLLERERKRNAPRK